jgi:hypothetical protein
MGVLLSIHCLWREKKLPKSNGFMSWRGVRYMLYLKSASGICDIFLGLRIVFDVQRGVRDIFLVVRTDSVFFLPVILSN